MEIKIRQKAGLTTKEYVISHGEKVLCYAYEAYRNFHNYIDIISARGVKPAIRVEIKRHRRIWNEKFTVKIDEERALTFRSSSHFHHTFELIDGEAHYEIIGHRGLNASVFRNDEQIAVLLKMNIISVFGADRYYLQMDKDADLQVLLALALIWDMLYGDRTIDLGQFLQRQEQDYEWKPKG